MFQLLTLLLVTLGVDGAYAPSGVNNCNRVSDGVPQPASLCRVRTLEADSSSLAAASGDGLKRLAVECNQLLLFESNIEANYFQRFSTLSELSLNNCKLLRIPGNAFEGLRDLKKLSIRSKNFDWSPNKNLELTHGTFNGLRELQTLDLGNNNLKAIPSDVFCPLDNLQVLNLTDNKVKSVDRLGFGKSCGSDLLSLDLSSNELKSLSEDSEIVRLKRLQELRLQHNNITDISGETFNGLISLRILNVSYNSLQYLPEGTFASTKELREIYLNNNLLFELARGVFHRLEQLLVLDLSNNQLSSAHVDGGTFVGLIRLVILNLSNNALTRIDGKTFKDLFFLQILDLRNNSIGYIEENTFLPLYNLHTLNLAENRLHSIDEFLFNGLFVLSKLNLNNNLLVHIDPKAFKNCSDLKELDMSSNQLTDVPEAIWELSLLKTLDLGENLITDIKNGSFKNLDQLTGLRLIDNDIGNLSVGMFWDLPSLQVLNLAKNKIQAVERGSFERNKQLEAIRLDGNFITDINGVFSALMSLLWLNLSENHLIWFDYAFIPSNLKWLDIHSNFIEHLGNYYKLQDELHIKTLDVSHNRIVEISPLAIPNSVELLFINNNHINNIQVNTFMEKSNLTRVDIYANEISRLDINSLRLAPVPLNKSLPEFYIGGNPFDCDCSMEWLPLINNMTAMRQHPRVMDLENVLCKMTHTRGVTHIPLSNLKSTDFLCTYETHCFALCHCCDYFACDCQMTCPNNCSCYHDPTWHTNVVDCSGQNAIEIPEKIPMDATEVYLDGNDFRELQNYAFIGRKNMRSLYVNSSGVESIQNRTFAGLSSLVILHLGNNKLKQLKGYEFEHLSQLNELYLQDNAINFIANATFSTLSSLKILRLDGNRLIDFAVWNLNGGIHLNSLALGNNMWSCKCRYLQKFTAYISDNVNKIVDVTDIWCWNTDAKSPQKKELNFNGTICSDYYSGDSVVDNMLVSNYMPMMVTTLSGFMLIMLVIFVIFLFRDAIRIWLYTTCGIRLYPFVGGYDETDKLYDAYVCYSPKDDDFVIQTLAAELENGSPSYHLCLHYRDIPQHGSAYMQCTLPLPEAAEAAKRIILVLSRNFLETEWSRFEYRQALHDLSKNKIHSFLIIEDSSAMPEAQCDTELRPYLKTCSSIKWGQTKFWEKLRYAMPDKKFKSKSTNYRNNLSSYTIRNSMQNGTTRSFSFTEKMRRAADGLSTEPEFLEVRPPQQLHSAYGADGRPPSDHIYSSIDSDYSSLERGGNNIPGRRRADIRHWLPPPPIVDPQSPSGQAYLV
ncbi:toll-like receptor 7 [Plutella xylostella]|uniref:toll-like receptor 7 n=1 Tax=Plutella xylostella TaxID=51655 RepID=UPI0020325AFF|nr:toll-like receptor 7 [Plutella xylostella]